MSSLCTYCGIDLIDQGTCIVCSCGEASCIKCSKKGCFCKKKNKKFKIQNLINLLEENPNCKNRAVLHSLVAKYYSEIEQYVKAYPHHVKAANLGIAGSQNYLARLYFYGLKEVGRQIDYKKAHFWAMLAAENKCYQSFSLLEIMYRDGLGVKKDTSRAYLFNTLGNFYQNKK